MSSVESIGIHPRRVRFDWSATPLTWVPGDPFTTHVMDVLHLLLPAGERWFCDVFRKALPLVADARVAEDVRGFIGQEATHARAHALVLEHLAARGLDSEPFTRRVEWICSRLLADRPLGIALPASADRGSIATRLAIIAAVEHFTCVLGVWITEHSEELDRAGTDPTMLDLLRWHGAEEVEHRAVAFDVYQDVCGSYALRVVGVAVVAPVLFWLMRSGVKFYLRNDPEHPEGIPGSIRRYVRVSRTGRLPQLGMLAGAAVRYLRPGHHPSREGSTEAALAYLARSPAVAR